MKKFQKVWQLLTIILKELNNWGFLNCGNARNKVLEMRNGEILYISMAILEMRMKAWKKREYLTFSLQSVFIYTSMHDGEWRGAVSDVHFRNIVYLRLYLKYLLFFTQCQLEYSVSVLHL
jgi:hypothetical protein